MCVCVCVGISHQTIHLDQCVCIYTNVSRHVSLSLSLTCPFGNCKITHVCFSHVVEQEISSLDCMHPQKAVKSIHRNVLPPSCLSTSAT